MAYEDFILNEKAIEKMAKEFTETKKAEEEAEEQVEMVSPLENILSGLKILERLMFASKAQTKNENILKFISDHANKIESIFNKLSGFHPNFSFADIDFESPQNDAQTKKMVQNILASVIVDLLSLAKDGSEKNLQDVILTVLVDLADILKTALNI